MISVAVLAGCGGSGRRVGCRGLPTAKHSVQFLVLFGRASSLTKRGACAQFGAPTSIKHLRHGREEWSYGAAAITFDGNRATRLDGRDRVPIGG